MQLCSRYIPSHVSHNECNVEAEHDSSTSFPRVQGPEPAVPVVAVALPGGGRAEPAGLELRGRGAGAARQERPLDGQRPLHLPRRQRRQGGRRGHAAEAGRKHGQKVMMGVVPRDQDRQFLPWPCFGGRRACPIQRGPSRCLFCSAHSETINTTKFTTGWVMLYRKKLQTAGGQNLPTKVFVLLHSNVSGT